MFAGLKRVARAIFVDDLRFERDEQGLRITLESGPASDETPLQRHQRLADERRRQQLATIRLQLAELFASLPGEQDHLQHLAQVDAALAEQGLAFLDAMPLAQLRAALAQFESAVLNWSPEGLAYLRSRMAVSLRERSLREGGAAVDALGDTSSLPIVREIAAVPAASPVTDADEAALLAAYGAAAGDPAERR